MSGVDGSPFATKMSNSPYLHKATSFFTLRQTCPWHLSFSFNRCTSSFRVNTLLQTVSHIWIKHKCDACRRGVERSTDSSSERENEKHVRNSQHILTSLNYGLLPVPGFSRGIKTAALVNIGYLHFIASDSLCPTVTMVLSQACFRCPFSSFSCVSSVFSTLCYKALTTHWGAK